MAASALAIPTIVAVGASAYADPAHCVADTTSFTRLSGNVLFAGGEGDCIYSTSLHLRVEIKQDLALLPDPVIDNGNGWDVEYATGTQWSLPVSSCDDGNNGKYYGRTYFTENVTYHDSSHKSYQTC